jgi:hypothetical protein
VELEIPSALNEDISSFRAQGFAVDDDNEPAPENIPTLNDSGADDIYQPRGSEPLGARKVAGVRDVQPSLVSTFCRWSPFKHQYPSHKQNPFGPSYTW